MSAKPTTSRLTDRKRAAIVEAAVDQFQAHGYDAASMDQIARVAEVSKRTVYNHFPSKEALFEAILDELRLRLAVIEAFPYDATGLLDEQLTCIGRSILDLQASDEFQNLARAALSRFMQSPQVFRETVGEPTEFTMGLVNWIIAARADGRLEIDDPEWAARQFTGLLETFCFWPQIIGMSPSPGEEQRRAIVQSAVAMFLHHYGRPRDAG